MFKDYKDIYVLIVNFEYILHFVLLFLFLTLSRQTPAGKSLQLTKVTLYYSDDVISNVRIKMSKQNCCP